MDKNTLMGLLLMGLVVFGFMWCGQKNAPQGNQASSEQTEAQKAVQSQQAASTADWKVNEGDINALNNVMADPELRKLAANYGSLRLTADSTGTAGIVMAGNSEVTLANILANDSTATTAQIEAARNFRRDINHLQSLGLLAPFTDSIHATKDIVLDLGDKMRVAFSNHGAQISEVVLKKFKVETLKRHGDVTLFSPALNNNSYSFTLNANARTFSTADLYFTPKKVNDSTVTMTLDLGNGRYWGIKYTVCPNDYIVKADIIQNGAEAVFGPGERTMSLDWNQKVVRNEEGRTFEERNSCVMYKYMEDSPDDLTAAGDKQKDLNERVQWVAFKNQFFSSVVVPRAGFSSADIASVDLKDANSIFLKDMTLKGKFKYNTAEANPAGFDFYFGPNNYSLLGDVDKVISPDDDLSLTKLVPLGWGIFGWINKLIVIPVFNFLGSFGWNYGIIILLLTIFIKIILFPFTYKSYISQAKMRVLAPEIKEINEKYPGTENAMKRQQETMALYSRVGASPFSGCLPLLLQMPILIAMFAFFPSCIELRGESFLWVKDLSAPDYICSLPFKIPFYGDHVSLFCLLMTVTNVIYTRINMQNQPGGSAMPGMKWMMYLMPVMFLFFFNDYAAGLSYYYFLSLLITILQTWIFRRVIDEKKVRAKMMENAKKPRKKKTGFMARLEEAQRRQQQMLREQQKAKEKKGRR